ncbi:MAG TPA: extracellular solute-binding protein [Candidatus Limiplasma sp.]|nr:extracellular solute-binding protein [Candidatus Limiplasma sp.]
MRSARRIAVFAIIAVCLLLVSCDTGQPSAVSAPTAAPAAETQATADGYPLQFRITWKSYSGRGEAIGAIVDQYNESSDNEVTLLDGDEDKDAIEALLQSDAETVYVLPYRYIQYFGDLGYLTDLTETFAADKAYFYDEIWSLATVDGKTFGIPWLGHSMCLLYNKTLLEHAGVDVKSITDMDSFIAALQTIADKTGAGGLGLVGAQSNDISWMVNQFIYGFGSSLVSEDGTTVTVNNAKSVRALTVYRDVLGQYAQPTWLEDTAEEVQTAFRNQEVAFEILGIWGVTDIIKNGSPFEVGILPLKTIGLCSEVGPMMLAIPASMSAEGKEAAVDFIRYMISKDAQEEIMKGEYSPEHDTYYPFRTPIRKDMADSEIFISHPEYQVFIEGFQNPSIDVPVPAWQTVKDEIYAPELHRVMTGEITIEAFLSEVEEQGNRILQAQ